MIKVYKPIKSILGDINITENADYVPYHCLTGVFTDAELEKIDACWSEENAFSTRIYQGESDLIEDSKYRRSKKMYLPLENNVWLYEKIAVFVNLVNARYFKFEISGFHGQLSFNQYSEGSFFDWHMDFGAAMSSTRKLVVSVQLSHPEEYEGGDFQLLTDKIVLPKVKGSVGIFPSYLLHRVTPVVSGCRKSLVAHIAGPPFK